MPPRRCGTCCPPGLGGACCGAYWRYCGCISVRRERAGPRQRYSQGMDVANGRGQLLSRRWRSGRVGRSGAGEQVASIASWVVVVAPMQDWWSLAAAKRKAPSRLGRPTIQDRSFCGWDGEEADVPYKKSGHCTEHSPSHPHASKIPRIKKVCENMECLSANIMLQARFTGLPAQNTWTEYSVLPSGPSLFCGARQATSCDTLWSHLIYDGERRDQTRCCQKINSIKGAGNCSWKMPCRLPGAAGTLPNRPHASIVLSKSLDPPTPRCPWRQSRCPSR